MKYLVSIFIFASMFLSGCITGHLPFGNNLTAQVSNTSDQATSEAKKLGQNSALQKISSGSTGHIVPVSATLPETACLDRF
ncbi:MAG: hypothetical protein WBG50_18250 [Desulfomonilaceae bacterium]